MSLTHRPPRDRPSADRMHKHFVERLARGGQPLVTRPLQELLPRTRRRRTVRTWQVAEVTGHAVAVLLATGLSIAATLAVVAHGMRWL